MKVLVGLAVTRMLQFFICVLGLALCTGAGWLFAGPQLVSLVDGLFTVADASLPADNMQLTPGMFSIGQRKWLMTSAVTVSADARSHLQIASAGHSFTLGPIQWGRGSLSGANYNFVPDAGDTVAFTKRRSLLAWPAPFQFSIMGGQVSSWRRYAYYHLVWTKASGATLEMVWRDEQWFYAKSGWSDAYLQAAPAIAIIPNGNRSR